MIFLLKIPQIFHKIKNYELRIMNYPPSPKAMEDRGIMNYGRCRACGTTNKMLDASSLRSSA